MIAYMIMCHKNAQQVLRLAKKLISSKSDVIIHADSTLSDDEYNVLSEASASMDGIYLTERRLHGVLDSRSLVDIAMEMVISIYKVQETENKHYKYFALLSGQDYPIKPLNHINSKLDSSYPKPFIDCTPYDSTNWIYHKFKGNNFVHNFKRKINELFPHRRNIIRKFLVLLYLILSKVVEILPINDYHKLMRLDIELYGGSAWWILPDIVINFIRYEYESQSDLMKLLLNSNTPEETFFQIMTMRSPVKNLVEINPKDMVLQNCKTWAYFSDDGKPFKGHPYIFTENEFDKLATSDCWFARKFDMNVDEKIFDMLDNIN